MSDDTFSGADISSAMSGGDTGQSTDPSVPPGDSSAPLGTATTQPGTATVSTSSAEPDDNTPGPRLKDHQRILENARQKAASEYEQKHWAKDYNADEVRALVQFRDALRADPATTLGTEIAELIQHPTYGPQLRSVLARHLGATGRTAAAPAPSGNLPTIQLEDGQVVDLNALRDEWMAKAREEMAPALQSAKELNDAKQHFVATQQANAFATGLMPELTGLPQFKEHAAEIKAALKETRLETDHPAEVTAAVYRIYSRIVGPKLATAGHQARLHDIHAKADAGTIGNPSSTTVNAPTSLKDLSWGEALQREYARQVG